jgi:hypothetical protein
MIPTSRQTLTLPMEYPSSRAFMGAPSVISIPFHRLQVVGVNDFLHFPPANRFVYRNSLTGPLSGNSVGQLMAKWRPIFKSTTIIQSIIVFGVQGSRRRVLGAGCRQ